MTQRYEIPIVCDASGLFLSGPMPGFVPLVPMPASSNPLPNFHVRSPDLVSLPAKHELKIDPDRLTEIALGLKTHEVRKFDRDFQVGDTLLLQAYDQTDRFYTGEFETVLITNITAPGTYGLPDGVGALSIVLAN